MSTDSARLAFVDRSSWPVLVITYPERASVEAIERMFEDVREHAGPGRFAIVGDLRPLRVSTANAGVRAAFAEHVASDRYPLPVAEAAVLGSAVARGLVTAYQWLSPAPHPIRVFEDLDEAITWARGVVEAT